MKHPYLKIAAIYAALAFIGLFLPNCAAVLPCPPGECGPPVPGQSRL